MAENACEEETLRTVTEENHLVMKSTGCSIEKVMKKLGNNNGSEKMVEIASRIPLYKAYQKVSRVLMHSPQTSERQISQDSDPQLFELLLLEKNDAHGNILMMSDIIPLEFCPIVSKSNEKYRQTLRPFLFNMQSHLVQKASKSMEDIRTYIEPKSSTSGEEEW
eukprot:938492_1